MTLFLSSTTWWVKLGVFVHSPIQALSENNLIIPECNDEISGHEKIIFHQQQDYRTLISLTLGRVASNLVWIQIFYYCAPFPLRFSWDFIKSGSRKSILRNVQGVSTVSNQNCFRAASLFGSRTRLVFLWESFQSPLQNIICLCPHRGSRMLFPAARQRCPCFPARMAMYDTAKDGPHTPRIDCFLKKGSLYACTSAGRSLLFFSVNFAVNAAVVILWYVASRFRSLNDR